MLHLRARQYEPTMMRFNQKDLLRGSMDVPQSLNRYAFVLNNPIMFADPSGEAPILASLLVGAAVGAAAGVTANTAVKKDTPKPPSGSTSNGIFVSSSYSNVSSSRGYLSPDGLETIYVIDSSTKNYIVKNNIPYQTSLSGGGIYVDSRYFSDPSRNYISPDGGGMIYITDKKTIDNIVANGIRYQANLPLTSLVCYLSAFQSALISVFFS